MAENKLNFGAIPKFDPYVPVDLKILGQKEIKAKTGKSYQILVCEDSAGREVSLFDWGLAERDGKPFVLKRHLASALDAAKNRN